MNPAARVQTAIELLDQIINACRDNGAAADRIITEGMKQRRYAGSKDRRAIRELVYRAIRRCGDLPENGRAAMVGLAQDDPELAAQFTGVAYGPAIIAADEATAPASLVPLWLQPMLAPTLPASEWPALLERAPLDVRINPLRADDAALAALAEEWSAIPGLPDARRVANDASPAMQALMEQGLIEVQDAGSQLVTLACPAKPGANVIDLCAGAGGKTLALAAMMENNGHIIGCDTDRARLSRLMPRAERAGVTIAETRLLNPGRELDALHDVCGAADAVLIDAPCSGMGTWRRNPEGRWRLTPARLERLNRTQRSLLEVGAELVRPGGALIYVVCSLLDVEGADAVDDFLQGRRDWEVDPLDLPLGAVHRSGWRLTPGRDGTDGFFVARLKRAW
ncbi:RsmB/NOP family class I SAM-dependent RNA methyltransferase [Aquisediminimonas sediminicola]|uniref:RsmB/NOP family class I SAM-dependent RNA methyltransferase n=1 Tax=Alteraquisediminimonas sediminicola TaxID=2676787 RepID=UPI001C8EB973|nr:RsmB/NOP family class I SAM-dependent RNA methyltransferase [Aquisediminimonas sediminicola]